MIVLLVHLTSNSMEISLVRFHDKKSNKDKADIFLSRSLSLNESLKGYLQEAYKTLATSHEKINKVVCVLGSAFSSSNTRIINHASDSEIPVDDNLLKKLSSSINKEYEIENEILYTKINGYPTSKPIGKCGKTLELTVYTGSAPNEIIQELKQSILPANKNTTFHTFSYIIFKTLSVFKGDFKPFLLINIEETDSFFSIIRSNSSFENISIDFGSNLFLSVVEENLNVDEKVAYSLLKMANEKTIDKATLNKFNGALEMAFQKWNSYSFNAISSLNNNLPMHETVYLISERIWSDQFKNILKKNDYRDFTYGKIGFEGNVFDYRDLSTNVSFEIPINKPFLIHLDVLFLEKYLI